MGKVMCTNCEEPVIVNRTDSPLRWVGLLLFVGGFFVLPLGGVLILIGLVLAIAGGSRRACPRCKRGDVVPLDSLRAKKIMEGHGIDATAAAIESPKATTADTPAICTKCGNRQPYRLSCGKCKRGSIVPLDGKAGAAAAERFPA